MKRAFDLFSWKTRPSSSILINTIWQTFMPNLPMRQLVDWSWTSPPVSRTSFWLDGSTWEPPDADKADVFVDRLARAWRGTPTSLS